ncbi:ribonuclease H-like domain-containing protein [Tanacetum coccineum]
MSQPANDEFSQHLSDEESNHEEASDTGAAPKQQQQVIPQTTAISNIKLPILKKEEYDIWAMEMEHYLEYIDNEVWKVIQNGNSKKRISTGKDVGFMAFTKEHIEIDFMDWMMQKRIWEAIRTRLVEGLEKGYDKFQQLLSQLEAHGAEVSTEDANHKFLRSLPPACTCTPSTSSTNVPEKEVLAGFADEEGEFRGMEKPPVVSTKISLNVFSIRHNTGHLLGKYSKGDTWMEEERVLILSTSRSWEQEMNQDGVAGQWIMGLSIGENILNKVGLGFEIQSNNEVLSFEEEMNFSVFKCLKEDSMGKPSYSRFTKTNDFKGVPHPLSGDYTPKPQEEIDDSLSVQLNAGRPKLNSVRPNINTGRTNINSVRPKVNAVSPKVNTVRSKQPRRPFEKSTAQMAHSNAVMGSWGSAVKTSASYNWRNNRPNFHYNSGPTFNRTEHPLKNMVDRGIFDSGCSGHMTDFDSVSFVKELGHFNLFSISQICDKQHKVLFTETECLVVSSDFKMPDENQILLKVPRHHNMYSFDMKTPTPAKGFACLIAKATSDESKLWHRRLGHINFKNLNKLVKGNLVRGLPSKDETSGILHNFIRQIKNQLNHRVKIIRSDNGTEFKNRDMLEFCGNKGIYMNTLSVLGKLMENPDEGLLSCTHKCIASKEKDEDVELIVVPSAVKNTEEKVESRTSSTNSKKERH